MDDWLSVHWDALVDYHTENMSKTDEEFYHRCLDEVSQTSMVQVCKTGTTPRPCRIKIFCESQSNQWPGDLLRVTMEGFEGFQKYFQGGLGR